MAHVPTEINFVGSSITECILVGVFFLFFYIDQRKARERELATIDGNRPAVGMLNPMRDKIRRPVPRGRRDDTCDHGLSRRPPTVKTSHELPKVKVMTKKKEAVQ